jgi:hypothetical protein
MLPTAGATSPASQSMADVISVVEVFPFVPVMPIHGAGRLLDRDSTRSIHASSTSLTTGMFLRWASRMKGVRGLNTGELITRSIPDQSTSSKEWRSASDVPSSTLITRSARPASTSQALRPETPMPATRTVALAISNIMPRLSSRSTDQTRTGDPISVEHHQTDQDQQQFDHPESNHDL